MKYPHRESVWCMCEDCIKERKLMREWRRRFKRETDTEFMSRDLKFDGGRYDYEWWE